MPTRTTIVPAVFRAASGIPITRQANMNSSLPVFYNGRESDGRTTWLTVTDLSLLQDVRLSGAGSPDSSCLNVLNLFDQASVTDKFRVQTLGNVLESITWETFFGRLSILEQRITANNILRAIRASCRTACGRRRAKSASASS